MHFDIVLNTAEILGSCSKGGITQQARLKKRKAKLMKVEKNYYLKSCRYCVETLYTQRMWYTHLVAIDYCLGGNMV